MEAGSDLATEEGEQHIDLAALERFGDMPVDAHERPVDGFDRVAGTIPPTKSSDGPQRPFCRILRPVRESANSCDSGDGHGDGLAVNADESFNPIQGAQLMRALAVRLEPDEDIAWQQGHGRDVAAMVANNAADFHRAIGDQVFAFDGRTGAAFSGEVGDGDKPRQGVKAIGQGVTGSGMIDWRWHGGILSHTERRPNQPGAFR